MATVVSEQDRHGVIMLATGNGTLLKGGLVAGAAVAVLTVILLAIGYLDADSVGGLIVTALLILGIGTSAGFIIKAEYATAARAGFAMRFPILYGLLFVTVLIVSFVMMPSTENFLGLEGLVSASLILPILILFGISVLYTVVIRRLVLFLIARWTEVDCIAEIYRPQLIDQLEFLWDAAERYRDPLTVAVLEIRGISDSGRLEHAVEELLAVAQRNCRRSDVALQISPSQVAVVLTRAPREKIGIPLGRIVEQTEEQGEVASIDDARVVAGVASYDQDPRPKDPPELLDQAIGELGKESNDTIRYSGLPHIH